MKQVVRTVYGASLQTAIFLGVDYQTAENSTLNEKFAIIPGETLDNGERPYVGYFVIGNGGHQFIDGGDGIPRTLPNVHSATDAACFNHMPFALRTLENDLTSAQRQRYALRRIETINDVDYAAYYAKRLNLDNLQVVMQRVEVNNGTKEEFDFSPTNENLNPAPENTGTNSVIEASGEYVNAFASLTIDFNAEDADLLKEAAYTIYGSEDYAVISEIGLVGGVDFTRGGLPTGEDGGSSITFSDVKAAQVVSFISTFYQLNLQNEGFVFTGNVGISEPLFGTSAT